MHDDDTTKPDAQARARQQLAREKESRALALRQRGASMAQVGQALRCSQSTARRLVARALERLRGERVESTSERVALEDARLDYLLTRATAILEADATPAAVKLRAITAALAVGEQRARLHGLHAPAKVQVRHDDPPPGPERRHTDEELAAAAWKLLNKGRSPDPAD